MEAARDRGFHISLDRKWANGVATGLECGLLHHEQAAPLTVLVLRRLGAAATTEVDFLLVLSLVGVLFSVAQADCFLHLRPQDVQDVGLDRVRGVLCHLKGERRQQFLNPVYERLSLAPPGSDFGPVVTPRGPIGLCPVSVFRLWHTKAVSAGAAKVAQCDSKQQLLRRLDHLRDCAQVQHEEPGRNRRLYSMHSARVAAVCCLLRAGLSEIIINTPANWSSDQIRRHTNRLALDLGLVRLWACYNPISLAGAYGEAPGSSPPPQNGRRVMGLETTRSGAAERAQ